MKTIRIIIAKILPFSLLFLFACQTNNFDAKIVSYLKDNCNNFPCTIRISEITNFEWDRMYVFSKGATMEIIQEAVGQYIPEKTQFTRKIVFTKNDNVVHYEELPTIIDEIVSNQVYFDNVEDDKREIYTVENAVFEAREYSLGDRNYFQLNQINQIRK